jgi:hypothetical protein
MGPHWSSLGDGPALVESRRWARTGRVSAIDGETPDLVEVFRIDLARNHPRLILVSFWWEPFFGCQSVALRIQTFLLTFCCKLSHRRAHVGQTS